MLWLVIDRAANILLAQSAFIGVDDGGTLNSIYYHSRVIVIFMVNTTCLYDLLFFVIVI